MTLPKLTKLELQIMEALWTRGEASIREIRKTFLKRKGPPTRQSRPRCTGWSEESRAARKKWATSTYLKRRFHAMRHNGG